MQEPESRPDSPDSQLTNSLYRATATIDDLTTTLTKVSRAPTPDGTNLLRCCCGREGCENTRAWTAFQHKLESRLILCAEVGQALLEKHEAYVRRHGSEAGDLESDDESRLSVSSRPETPTMLHPQQDLHLESKVTELLKENMTLEKRLNSALINNEVAESSNKTLLKELSDARETISRLTLNQAKSAGWEVRLNASLQDKDDLKQELDSERQRVKAAECQVSSLKERSAKQQAEISVLHEELEQHKLTRTELSEEILRDARARLEMIQQSQLGHTILIESPEVTQVMESLVADNEALKRDIAELQNLLAEAREDVRVLREEVEETMVHSTAANPEESASARVFSAPSSRPGHNHTYSWASSFGQTPLSPSWNNNDASKGIPRSTAPSIQQTYEPLTPNTDLRPLSPAQSRTPSERRFPPLSTPWPKYPPSHLSVDTDDRSLHARTPETPEKRSPRRPLLLLTHSRGIQTESISWPGLLHPSYARSQAFDDSSSATPPGDGRSESSSLADGQSHASTIAALVDRTNALFTRITQADALTLTNRLKRQHLAGDVSHLSKATVSSILSEANGLRTHFRAVLEDEKVVSTCTRRDLRALLSLFREIFAELGQLRITMNDVILDPSIAQKVSEMAMDPSKGLDESRGRASSRPALSGWMAPISKLFSSSTPAPSDSKSTDVHPSTSRSLSGPLVAPVATRPKPQRFVPKLGPALAASTTTVNVEFSGTGVGRSVSSAMTTTAGADAPVLRSTTPAPQAVSSRAVMGIFAGTLRNQEADPWIVVSPKPQRKLRGAPSTANFGTATLSRSTGRWGAGPKLPRNVDAVIDSESAASHNGGDEEDAPSFHDTLLERTLRPRGLSDSSIRSTFLADEERSEAASGEVVGTQSAALPPHAVLNGAGSVRQGAFPGHGASRASVLQALSKTVQAFKTPVSSGPASEVSASPPSSNVAEHASARAASPRRINILPSLASWAATQAGLDAEARESFVGSVREEDANFGHRTWHRDVQGRDI